jgi:hypothetical protein
MSETKRKSMIDYGTDPRACTIEGWIAALQILAKYVTPKVPFSTGAEHDILYLGPGPEPLDVNDDGEYIWPADQLDDALELDRLGFHYNLECDSWAKLT